MPDRPIRVIVADDHPLFRAGVALSLEETGRFEVVGRVGDAEAAVTLAGSLAPDVALVDLSMPGGGVAAVARIAETAPGVVAVVLTASEAEEDVLAALKAGARGYVLKGVAVEALAEVIEGALRGESYVPPSLAARILSELTHPAPEGADPLARLTLREEEILRLVSDGLSNKEVARRLDLQEKTVKHHMTSILGKLNVRNRTEAALLARGMPRRAG